MSEKKYVEKKNPNIFSIKNSSCNYSLFIVLRAINTIIWHQVCLKSVKKRQTLINFKENAYILVYLTKRKTLFNLFLLLNAKNDQIDKYKFKFIKSIKIIRYINLYYIMQTVS
jgi:hypothetical protein